MLVLGRVVVYSLLTGSQETHIACFLLSCWLRYGSYIGKCRSRPRYAHRPCRPRAVAEGLLNEWRFDGQAMVTD